MAISPNLCPVWILFWALLIFDRSLWCCSASAHYDRKHGGSLNGLFRSRRDVCVDGSYEFNGRTCCNCPRGQALASDCALNPNDRVCDLCKDGTYNSEPNHDTSCKPCTSCNHPSVYLELEEPCTPAKNAKCRCQANHWCFSRSPDGNCLSCNPCKVCGVEGQKNNCTADKDAVCNSEVKPGTNATDIAVGLVFAFAAIAAAVGAAVYFKVFKRRPEPTQTNPDSTEVPLLDEIGPHVPDIADIIGWKEMERIAIRSNIQPAVIESCNLNHPHDIQTQTQKLLGIWVERQGRDASKKLIEMLKNSGNKNMAEKVIAKLNRGSTAGTNGSV